MPKEFLDRALASNPQPAGDVVLLHYNKTSITGMASI